MHSVPDPLYYPTPPGTTGTKIDPTPTPSPAPEVGGLTLLLPDLLDSLGETLDTQPDQQEQPLTPVSPPPRTLTHLPAPGAPQQIREPRVTSVRHIQSTHRSFDTVHMKPVQIVLTHLWSVMMPGFILNQVIVL